MISVKAIIWRKLMRKRLLLIAVVAFFTYSFFLPQLSSENQTIPLKIIQFKDNSLNVSWKIQDLQVSEQESSGQKTSRVSFENHTFPQENGMYEIPITSFQLGIPDNSEITFELSDVVYELRENINLAPFARTGRDKHGISITDNSLDNKVVDVSPKPIIKVHDQHYFRDLPVVKVDFYPVQYDPGTKKLKIITSATIKFKFNKGSVKGSGYIPGTSKLDPLYDKMVLNFNQAKNWIIRGRKDLKKLTSTYAGPWFKIEVTEDGLYKINANTLGSAGINIQDIDPRTIKIYNHGGNTLRPDVQSYSENPVGPLETAIYVSGEADGRFDSQDYVLFYGTGAGGWYFSEIANDFIYNQHPYDTKNYYLLTYGENTGKRMQTVAAPTSGATTTDTYFMERVHRLPLFWPITGCFL
jgi:hypothetical protein